MSATERPPVIPTDNLVPCCGAFCCFHSLLTTNIWSGCYGRVTLPCILMEQTFCRPLENDAVYCCTCSKSECLLGYTKVCCQLESQCCCWDWRCSIPQRDDHPCILNIFFINCCYKFKRTCRCCETVRQMEDQFFPPSPPPSRPAATGTAVPRGLRSGVAEEQADGEAVGIFTTEAFPVETNVVADARIER